MKIEIDQSGKIENTEKPTVIAFSNSINRSVIMLSKDKKQIQNLFRKAGTPRIFVYKTFAVLIYFLIKSKLKSINQILIDIEYPGYNRLIKQFLCELFTKNNIKFDSDFVHFKEIGKESNAHITAISAYRNKSAETKITYKDFLKITL